MIQALSTTLALLLMKVGLRSSMVRVGASGMAPFGAGPAVSM